MAKAVEQVAGLGQAYASVGVAENVRIVAFGFSAPSRTGVSDLII